MKRRRINATEKDHYTIEDLHISITWLHPTLEISIVNWLILLKGGNPQYWGLKGTYWTNHLKKLANRNGQADHKRPNYLLRFKRAHSWPDSACIVMVTQCITLPSCIPSSNIFMTYRNMSSFEGTMLMTKLRHEPSFPMPSFLHEVMHLQLSQVETLAATTQIRADLG